jgi:hypothetical protein
MNNNDINNTTSERRANVKEGNLNSTDYIEDKKTHNHSNGQSFSKNSKIVKVIIAVVGILIIGFGLSIWQKNKNINSITSKNFKVPSRITKKSINGEKQELAIQVDALLEYSLVVPSDWSAYDTNSDDSQIIISPFVEKSIEPEGQTPILVINTGYTDTNAYLLFSKEDTIAYLKNKVPDFLNSMQELVLDSELFLSENEILNQDVIAGEINLKEHTQVLGKGEIISFVYRYYNLESEDILEYDFISYYIYPLEEGDYYQRMFEEILQSIEIKLISGEEHEGFEELNRAILNNDLNYCINVADETIKHNCYNGIAKVTGDKLVCSQLPDQKYRDICFHNLGSETGVLASCEEISDISQKDDCYLDIAVPAKNKSICENINDGNIRRICQLEIAVLEKDISICKEIDSSGHGECFFLIPEIKEDIPECQRLTSLEEQKFCFQSQCDRLIDPAEKEFCYKSLELKRDFD